MFTLRYRASRAWDRLTYHPRDYSKPYSRRGFWLERAFCPLMGLVILATTIDAYFFEGFTPQAMLIDKVVLGLMLVLCICICAMGTWFGWRQYRRPSNWVQPHGTTFTSTA